MAKKRFFSIITAIIIMTSAIISGIPSVFADDTGTPDFSIQKSIDRTSFFEGEAGKLTYTFMPDGTAAGQDKSDADIVMVLDISTSMEDGNKIEKAVDAAAEFFDKLKGTKYKAALVTFGYKVDYASSLNEGYPALINKVKEYKEKAWFFGYYYKNLMSGTNYDDGLRKAKDILKKGKAGNQYVVFITDGMPNYFTSTTKVDKYHNNSYRENDGSTYYYTNHPKSTPEAYSYPLNDVRELAEAGVEVFTVGVGKGNEVDMDFLEEITQAGSGKLYQVVDPDSMSDIFNEVSSEISDISISNIKIREKLPEGISLDSKSNASIDDEGYVVINVPPITFNKDSNKAPEPFAVDLNIIMNAKGSYDLDDSKVQYKTWNGNPEEKPINSVSLNVTAAEGAPALKVSKFMLNSSAVIGENINLEYRITPEGVFSSQGTSGEAVDMVILFDKSSNMQDNYGNGNNRKHMLEKEVAVSLVHTVKAMNNGSRIGYIEYNRYAKSVKTLTANYQSVIDSINLTNVDTIPAHESGVNYEAALKSAEKLLEGSTNKRMIVLLTGSKPDYYDDLYSEHKDYVYYKVHDKEFKGYLDANSTKKNGKTTYNWDAAYNSYYNDKLKGKYDIAQGYYPYLSSTGSTTYRSYTEAEDVVSGMEDTALHVMAIGKYHENSSTSDDDYNLGYLRDLSEMTGGKTYEYTEKIQLYNEIKTGEAATSEYKMQNLVITEVFPAGIEILESDNITIDPNNPLKFTANIPDIVFVDGKGTPSPVVLTIKVKFKEEGDYTLSNTSKLDYMDNAGTNKVLNFNKLNINVANPNYRIEKVIASKVYEDTAVTGIKVDWNGNLLSNTGAISKFILMRSISGGDFEEIARTDKTVFEYLDTDTGVNGRYLYRIDTLLANGEIVVGIPSNEVLIVGKGLTNISSISQAIQINGQTITKAYESYKLNYMIDLNISDDAEGKTAGGITNPEFSVSLNSANIGDVLYDVKDGTVKLTKGDDVLSTDKLTYQINENGTSKANLVISYNGVLEPGSYKIIFDAVPRKAREIKLPDEGMEIIMELDIRWKDFGIETENSQQLEYRLWIMPLPKLM